MSQTIGIAELIEIALLQHDNAMMIKPLLNGISEGRASSPLTHPTLFRTNSNPLPLAVHNMISVIDREIEETKQRLGRRGTRIHTTKSIPVRKVKPDRKLKSHRHTSLLKQQRPLPPPPALPSCLRAGQIVHKESMR